MVLLMTVITAISPPVLPVVVPVFLAPGSRMSKTVSAVAIIADGQMHAPIDVDCFPLVETPYQDWIANQPDIAWPEVKTRVADITNIFDAVPSVIIWNFHDYGSRCHNYGRRWREGCWSNDNCRRGRPMDYYPTGLHDTPCH
jgi:hypothetical protein